jgi:hypothetical protein
MQSMVTIGKFLREVGGEKRAAEANTEPGSIGGPTSHPVKDVDDSTADAKEGDRSAENAADVKADQGKPGVDSTPDNVADKKASAKRAADGKSSDGSINPPGTASADQLQIGTKKEPTGQDPSVETSSVKAEKEDTDTSHPARTDNAELDGLKYASMSLEQLAKTASELGNLVLAGLANMQHESPAAPRAQSVDKQAADLAGQAGWELAGLLTGNFDKQAADSLVQHTVEEVIKTAADDAEKVASFLVAYSDQLAKQAEGEEMPEEAAAADEGAGEMPPEMSAGPAPGGEASGGGGELEQLAALLEQLGITPEQLEAAMAQGGGDAGGAGEMPPEAMPPEAAMGGAGGMPPAAGGPETAGAAPGMEVSAADKGRATKRAAQKGAADQTTRDYVQEVLARSRQ